MKALRPDIDLRLPERLRHVRPACGALSWAGDPSLLTTGLRVGIIGSRHPRGDSVEHARRIAADAARLGFTVVSGLAIGIDAIAHRACLDAGGRTVAVLASGLASVYPPSNLSLARTIAGSSTASGVVAGAGGDLSRGVVLTEYGSGDESARRERFILRNRLIAALSDYLVVVQALPTSGSMKTADFALDLGVPIGIVPSGPGDPEYGGSISLVRDGADCVIDGVSLAWRLERSGVIAAGGAAACAARLHAGQMDLLHDHPLAEVLIVPRVVDEIAELAGMELRFVRRLLGELEDEGLVSCGADGLWRCRAAAEP